MPKKIKGENKGWANLKPAKKGEVRNPKGRPKKDKCIPDILRMVGEEELPEKLLEQVKKFYPDKKKMSHIEAIQRLVYIHAIKGEGWAFNYIADRTEGKPKQSIDIKERTVEVIIIE